MKEEMKVYITMSSDEWGTYPTVYLKRSDAVREIKWRIKNRHGEKRYFGYSKEELQKIIDAEIREETVIEYLETDEYRIWNSYTKMWVKE